MNLTELVNKYKTDRDASIYEEKFQHLRDSKINLCEIGIHNVRFPCASVKMWEEYFPHAEIYGFDIDNFSTECETCNRVHIFIGNQSTRDDLIAFKNEANCQFDIIIDDGSHIDGHQLTTLAILFPTLKPDGFYIIEDIHVAPHTASVFEEFVTNGEINTYWMTNEEKTFLKEKIKSCEIHSKLAIIKS